MSHLAGVLVAVGLLSGALAAPAAAAPPTAPDPVVVVAQLREVDPAEARADAESVGGEVLYTGSAIPFGTFEVPADRVDDLERRDGVVAVSRLIRFRVALDSSVAHVGGTRLHALGVTGAGSVVAVLDDGVQVSHPTFGSRLVEESCFAPVDTTCPNGQPSQVGAGAASTCTSPWPCAHGTHVSGIAVGEGGGGAPAGVAPGAGLLAIRIFSDTSTPFGSYADTSSILAGLDHSLALKRAGVPLVAVNLSLNFDGRGWAEHCDGEISTALLDATARLRDAGVAVTVATGNEFRQDGIGFPSCLSTVVPVAASSDTDSIPAFSNTAPGMGVVLAPGVDVTSASAGGGASTSNGTSMAAPHVAGAYGLLAAIGPPRGLGATTALIRGRGSPVTTSRGTFPRLDILAAARATGAAVDARAAAARLVGDTGSVRTGLAANTAESAEPAHAGLPAAHSAWFRYRPRLEGVVRFSALPQGGDVRMAAYRGRSSAPVRSSSGTASRAASIDVPARADEDIYVAVDSGAEVPDLVTLSWSTLGDSIGTSDGAVFWLDRIPDPDLRFRFGRPGDVPLSGDWDGDGVDSVGVYRSGIVYLRNTSAGGAADIAFAYGRAGDIPITGDWDGDGDDSIGIFRDGTVYLRHRNSNGPADLVFGFGRAGDVPLGGDWDGDGDDTIGIFRGGVFHLRNANSNGYPHHVFLFGRAGDLPLAGDWDADGTDTTAVDRAGRFYLHNSHNPGAADYSVLAAVPEGEPLAGVWVP